jgi:hypothetical protein
MRIEKYIKRSSYSTPSVVRMISSKRKRCARNVARVGIRTLRTECILNLEGSRHVGDLLDVDEERVNRVQEPQNRCTDGLLGTCDKSWEFHTVRRIY